MKLLLSALLMLAVVQKTAPAHLVTDALSQAPVPFARVLFVKTDSRLADTVIVEADDRGRFSTAGVPPGNYRVIAEHDAYVRGSVPQSVTVVAGQPLAAMLIALTPTAIIAGRVLTEAAEPAPKIFVRAHAMTAAGAAPESIAQARTNDLGEFRLFGLAPGTYAVSAERYPGPSIGVVELPGGRGGPPGLRYIVPTPPCPDCRGEGRFMMSLTALLAVGDFIDPQALDGATYPRVYFPGTTDAAQAKGVTAGPGARLDGIDIQLVVVR